MGDYADDDIVLHPAWRTASDPGDLVGKATVLARQDALLKSHRGTMVMDVESISANDSFGTVLGTIRTQYPQVAAIPFCGVWRFRNGRIVEHWENAYNAQDDVRKLTQGHE
ncbi:nuclear transport factor 2 family protein [Solwaraspora sp. WMMD791]|uniref:nuclear transport factor 2 family protein n=1 Tax=Solwaraspora sp. WMMD791 TaxID=3016086 RepID=UPI0032B5E32F